MSTPKKTPCPKKEVSRTSYAFRLKVIDGIANGQISVNYASKKYNISRSSINYWMNKMLSFDQKHKFMSSKKEIQKLKQRIEVLEFIKDIQQEIMAEIEIESGKDIVKKYLPESLQKEVEKKKVLLKRDSSTSASGSASKPTTND